ncbi:exodeoxyribonuclease VII large subunit [Thiolapillus sp.]
MTNSLNRDIWSVSRLNGEIRAVLEGSFPLLWVEGEISNLATPRSGHAYFSLKDEHAQVRCALFRNRRMRLRFQPKDGDRVLVRARISLYEARGDFQLIIEHMEPAGEGALQRAFEELKARLEAEGLFDARRKLPLPAFPRCIGVVTSPTGAAVRDILQVLRRRFPGLPVIIYPTLVQGEGAAEEIAGALRLADQRKDCDLLILARGGGSLEDLWAFNDEALARTIAGLRTPVISAIGHETDFTIADFVADRRAPTPSAAAELATPDGEQLARQLEVLGGRLGRAMRGRLGTEGQRLEHQHHRLLMLHPLRRIHEQQQRLDELGMRMEAAMNNRLARHRQSLGALESRLRLLSPARQLRTLAAALMRQREQLQTIMEHRLSRDRLQLEGLARELHAVSPLQTLARGYSITMEAETGKVITRADEVAPGTRIRSRLEEGELLSIIEQERYYAP